MIILFAGKYTGEYNRDKIILEGLKKRIDVEIIEYKFSKKKNFNKLEFKELSKRSDVIYCPSFSHKYVRLIKKNTSKPVIFDPLISNYLTKVFDYKNIKRRSPRAFKNYLKDKLAFNAADILIADTEQHKIYYNKTFSIPLDKIHILPVGANTSLFKPIKKCQKKPFVIGFYGGFIPLQGVHHIVEAAFILGKNTDISFNLIGTGYEYEKMKKIVAEKDINNVHFEGWVNYNELPLKIAEFDICLGIFGDTLKANLVIPNKIFHYAAMAKPIITMDSPAIREIFSPGEDIELIENNGKAVAQAILSLVNNESKQTILGENARKLAENKFNENKIAQKLISIVGAIQKKAP
jgi:glycosyltransferase involved in cell wall biosynthesis